MVPYLMVVFTERKLRVAEPDRAMGKRREGWRRVEKARWSRERRGTRDEVQ
jgi:hypothetical protein